MSENSPSIKKEKPQINYPKITPKVIVEPPEPLPFSLRNQSVIEAMSFLGISADDITALPYHHFLKAEKNESRAKISYDTHISIRADLIKQIEETRKKIQEKTEKRLSPDVIYERKLANRDENILKTKMSSNKQILKTIALKQLRAAYKIQQTENKIQYQQKISNEYDQKMTQKLKEAKEKVDKQIISPDKGENAKSSTFLKDRSMMEKSENDSEKRILFLTQQKKQKIEESAKAKAEKARETIERQNRQYNEKISQMQQRLNKNEEVMSSIPIKNQQRDDKLSQKAALRNEKTKEVERRNFEFTKQKVEKVEKLLQTEQLNFERVMNSNKQKSDEKIGKEADLLKKRNEAAEKIFNKQKENLENYKNELERRDTIIKKNQDDLINERTLKLHQNKIELENKTAAVRRSQRARDCATAFALRKRTTWSTNGLDEFKHQRAKSQLAKAKASETFTSQMNETIEMLPGIVKMNDDEKVISLKKILGISEEEAKEIVLAAKNPSSIH